MLIESPRHTNEDRVLWERHVEVDMLVSNRQRMRMIHATSLNALIHFTLDQPPCYCGVSWGKDSVVTACLLRCVAPHVVLVHLRPTNHNPDCDAVRDFYFDRFPGQPYCELQVDYGNLHGRRISHDVLDRETDSLWKDAWAECRRKFGDRHISGVRADESTTRMLRCAKWGTTSPRTCAPLADWVSADVFAFAAMEGLPLHPAYGCLGGGRWPRDRIRTAEIGDTHGGGGGRAEWEQEYYGDVLRRLNARIGRD